MCLSATVVNSVGLLFDIVGAFILFFFGLPTGQWWYLPKGKTPRLPYLGLSFLILGFTLQLISNFLR